MNGGVLFVMPTWATPSELWLQRMLEALRDRLVGVACYHPEDSTWRGECPTIDLVSREQDACILAAAIERQKPASVLVHYLPFALRLAPALRDSGASVFVHAHGYDVTWGGHRPEPPYERRFDEQYPERVRAMSQWATLIANSRHTMDRLVSIGVDADRIVLKPLGVPVPATPADPPDTPPLRVLYLGRLIDFKGPDLTVLAFAAAVERGLDAVLTVAGDGPERERCEALAAASAAAGRISFLGVVDADTGERLRLQSHIFTAHNRTGPFTRQEEAFGVSFVEAMACGLPVVSGRNGSLPEIVSDGQEGLLVEPGDVDAHARALLQLAHDPCQRKRLGNGARTRATHQYAQHREAAQLLSLVDGARSQSVSRDG